MRDQWEIALILTVFFGGLFVFLGAGCARREASTVSLLDQMPDGESSAQWRVIVKAAGRVSLQQCFDINRTTSVNADGAHAGVEYRIRRHLRLRSGETVGIMFSFEKRKKEQEVKDIVCTARALSAGEEVVRMEGRIRGSTAWLVLRIPGSGADRLEILHGPSPVAIDRVVVVAGTPDTNTTSTRRIRTLLGWALKNQFEQLEDFLSGNKLPVSNDGRTMDCCIMAAGDTLIFDLPGESPESRLNMHVLPLKTGSSTGARLMIDVLDEDEWSQAGKWSLATNRDESWRAIALDDPIESSWKNIRFRLSGKGAIVAVGEPVLIPPPNAAAERMNLILIDLDTVRADRLGCYGYTRRPTSARLDSVLDARGFFVFRNAYSTAPVTVPATARFLTSTYLLTREDRAIPRQYDTLAEILRENGYLCAAFTGGGYLRAAGFEQGFHQYHWAAGFGKVEDSFPAAAEWLQNDMRRPFFLFLHTYEAHRPYTRDTFCRGLPTGRLGDLSKGEPLTKNRPHRSPVVARIESLYIESAYDGGVRKACDATADLFELLDEQDLWRNTMVILVSDHGEEFWNHSPRWGEHPWSSVYGELLNVPFLLYSPLNSRDQLTPVYESAGTIDLLPTVLDLLGLPLRSTCQGVSLVPALEGRPVERTIPLLAVSCSGNRKWMSKAGIIFGDWKYISPVVLRSSPEEAVNHDPFYPNREELFNIRDDPDEMNDIATEDPEISARMRELLLNGLDLTVPVDSSVSQVPVQLERGDDRRSQLERQLRALGYIDDRL